MATAIKLYYTYSTALGVKWELIPSKLLVVEDIESYLATKTYKNITDFQYIKNELELSISVDLGQSYSQPRSETNFKYVSIQNEGEQVHYYFVKKANWRSKTCVRFDLVMDVLNTFQEGRDFNFKANTRIVREHKPRFKGLCTLKYTFSGFNAEGSQPFQEGMEVWIAGSDGSSPRFHGTFISTGYDSLREEYYFIMSSESRITMSAFNDFVQECIDDLLYVKFYNSATTYVEAYCNFLSDEPDWEMTRVIDIVNEGISPILQCGNAKGEFIESEKLAIAQDWYLLYRNQNDPDDSLLNPVECYLIPENDTDTDSAYIEAGRLIPSFIEEGKYYYFAIVNGQATLSNGVTLSYPATGHQILMITKAGGVLSCTHFYASSSSPTQPVIYNNYDGIDYVDFTSLPVHYRIENNFLPSGNTNYYDLQNNMPYDFNNSGDLVEAESVSKLDKGDPKNIKLIKLPYVPYNFNMSSPYDVLKIDGDSNWDLTAFSQQSAGDMIAMKLTDLNVKLHSEFYVSDEQPLEELYAPSISPALTDLRKGQEYESKLLHSDFFQPTYAYDSFTYKIPLEKIDIDLYTPDDLSRLKIRFDMTSTINSRFMFSFPDLKLKNATENYATYMPIARNNEEVLYNVPYINYIKTGFNYDVKSKNVQNLSNIAGLGLSALSTGASLLLPSVPLKIAGVVAGLVSMAMSIKNTAVSAIQNEDSIKRKIAETQNQASSVAGSDDVDLMSIYAENRLKYLVYEPTALMKSILFDLFFYAGYASGRMGKPNHDTRVNFDYLECEASLENEGSIPDDCLQELLNCFKSGVCYLHKTTRASEKWDFEQKYENWEKFLFN